jgi:hypothetical protein
VEGTVSFFYRLPYGWWKVAWAVGMLALAAMGIAAEDDGG